VFDGEGGSLGGRGVLRPVDAQQLVAEEAGAGRGMAALAHLLEAQAERGAEVEEPLEVGRREPEGAGIDTSFRADELGVLAAGHRWAPPAGR